jgi:hypothetical protein
MTDKTEGAKEVEFPAPQGFAAPEDTEPGKSFEVMATVRMKDDGKVCLEAIDGVPVSYKEESETPEMETAEGEDPGFLAAIEKGMTEA